MANMIDETSDEIMEKGRDVNVVAKKIPVVVGRGSLIFEIMLWVLGIVPGIVFLFMKINAKNYFMQLEQKIQHNASQIDNYLEQRVVVLQNCARLIEKATQLDKETYENISRYRSGKRTVSGEESRNEMVDHLDSLSHSVNLAVESYPELGAHAEIRDAMKQNMYLQREISAARDLYNDSINSWNRDIFAWPTKMIVAAKNGYTTRIPFAASSEIKQKARDVFF